jgi:Phage terminase large subunit (GpA)
MIQPEDFSIRAWIREYGIVTENGLPLTFKEHGFLKAPYEDESAKLAILKAAQIGFSTLAILKSFWIAKKRGLNIIYTLPTVDDVKDFVGDKVNRIIAQNPILQDYTKDRDSIEQKQIGNKIIHYRGTFTQKAAMMVSSDLNIYDEVDASNQRVIEQYSTRLQHSQYKWEWYFSHPSAEGSGVDRYWQRSDQKHWFIKCHSCNKQQYLSWPESIDIQRQCFQCKFCKTDIGEDRKKGEWVKRFKGREISGYWIPLLICPWVTAKEIIDQFNTKSEEQFYNKVLGLPYVGGGNKLTKANLMRNLTSEVITPERNERVVIGVDTGKKIHFVAGGEKGIFYYSQSSDYEELAHLLGKRWPRSIAVIDQGGDLIGSRQLREQFPGRVFLCSYGEDRKTGELVRWGKNDEDGTVITDRNRMIQLVVDEFTDRRIPIQGTENDWYDYWVHWNNLTRVVEENDRGMVRKIWVRNGDDHWAHATAYWRTGMSRFSETARVIQGEIVKLPESYELRVDQSVQFNPKKFFKQETEDWRKL